MFLNLFGKEERRSSSKPPTASSSSEVRLDDNQKKSSSDMEDAKKYTPFLFDFSYLHNPEEFEATLTNQDTTTTTDGGNNNAAEDMADLEREFAINHLPTIQEYYTLFTSIYNYQSELNRFSSDLTKGYFIQYTVESVLLDQEGRALLCEAVWLYGVILIVLERLLPGSIRERFIIAHFRLSNEGIGGDISTIESI
eukprot:scaffold24260_cov78-Skeletonema_dohrnii-CCMP3373.AAC.1